jgi:DNA replication and repair protein RecF
MGEAGEARLEYAPGVAGDLLAALEKTRERDMARGRTSVGPHRDELRLTVNGRELRTYGSAGQHRTAALALRLCEAETLEAPTICLDDAFAELDGERSVKLGALVEGMAAEGKQVIAAVPKEGEVPDVIASLPRWRIESGQVHP